MDQRTKDAYFPAFDYIRILAAVGVFAGHAKTGIVFGYGGNACVQIFFALSGFLIGGILLKAKPGDLPRFFFNRSVRIWIPYALAIALLALVTAIKQGIHDPKFFEFFAYMATFTYNWFGPQQLETARNHMPLEGTGNHFWSICVEEQFYLLAPFIVALAPRAVSVGALAGLTAINVVWPHNFAAISIGVLLAMAAERRLTLTIICVAAFLLTVPFVGYEIWMPFLAGATIGFASLIRGAPSSIGLALGGASFSFYLNHWIGIFAANALMRYFSFWPATAAGLFIALSFSLAHYFWIDRRLQANRGNWFSMRLGALLCGGGYTLLMVGLVLGILVNGLNPFR